MVSNYSKKQMVEELERELSIRKSFYARQIKKGLMERKLANKYWDRMYSAKIFIDNGNVKIKGITLKDMAVELRRELHLRIDYYAKLIKMGEMTRDKANDQYLRMKAALDYIVACDMNNKGSQTQLFMNAKTNYNEN